MLRSRQVVMPALIWSFLVVLMVKPVHAFDHGHDLLVAANAESPGMELAFIMYVAGVWDAYTLASADHQMYPSVCMPEDTMQGEAADVVRRYMQHGSVYGIGSTEPKDFLDWPGVVIVLSALRTRYRCGE